MKVIKQYEDGPTLIEMDVFKDDRGYFYESFNEKEFNEKVSNTHFVQDNQSKSSYGTIRGMHFQKGEYAQAKLVRVVKGTVIDVVVNIMPDSKHYLETYTAYLSEDNHRQFFVPRGFAHGFISLSDDTVFQYKCDNYYNKESEGSFNFMDVPNFDWEEYVSKKSLNLSEKDLNAPSLKEMDFTTFRGLSKVKKYKELNLETIKEILFSSSIFNSKQIIDYQLVADTLTSGLCYANLKDSDSEWKIENVSLLTTFDFSLSTTNVLVLGEVGSDVIVKIGPSEFYKIVRIYIKDE